MSKVEIMKHGNQVNIDRYEEEHNPKITFICNRCGCEWKCQYFDNTFGTAKDFNGDPDIICPECGKDSKRIITAGAGISFQGTGFYVNDSSSSCSGKCSGCDK